VTAKLQAHLSFFDLIVGTEEEFHIAGGSTRHRGGPARRPPRVPGHARLQARREGRGRLHRRHPRQPRRGETGPGFPIEVFNVLGAGDGFMSGLLKGWLDGEPWPVALRYANACGALAVSRHGCTPAYPSLSELEFFLGRGVTRPDLRHDAELEQIHWSTNRHGRWDPLRVFAFDHRLQMEEMEGATPARIGAFKRLCLEAARRVAAGRPGFGVLCDGRLGLDALHAAAGSGLWIGRPVEWPGSRPLRLEPEIGPDMGGLSEWPLEHVVKVLCFCHPGDHAQMWADQEATLRRLFAAARRNRLEVLLEVIPSKVAVVDEGTTAAIIERVYGWGLFPDWWKLEPFATAAAWRHACGAIKARDPHVRGVLVLGLDGAPEALAESFALAAREPLVKGFAVGRTIFGNAARAWFKGELDDGGAVDEMARRFASLCSAWDAQRGAAALVGPKGDAGPLAAREG
jgi:5-dehydro-2-deoxygluconokinase